MSNRFRLFVLLLAVCVVGVWAKGLLAVLAQRSRPPFTQRLTRLETEILREPEGEILPDVSRDEFLKFLDLKPEHTPSPTDVVAVHESYAPPRWGRVVTWQGEPDWPVGVEMDSALLAAAINEPANPPAIVKGPRVPNVTSDPSPPVLVLAFPKGDRYALLRVGTFYGFEPYRKGVGPSTTKLLNAVYLVMERCGGVAHVSRTRGDRRGPGLDETDLFARMAIKDPD